MVTFILFDKNARQVIGLCGFFDKEKDVYENCCIGIGPAFVGKGYGKQILNALIEYMVNKLKASKVICDCDT